jgi:ribosomal protein S17E
MANKKDSEVLDKKTLEKFRKEIKDDFERNYKDEIVKELSDKVSEEVTNRFNAEYKNQLIDEVTVDVKDEVKFRIEREEKKIYRHKSFKIFRLSVYLLVLLGIIGYVAYRLYITNNMDLVRYDYEPPKTTQAVRPQEENKKQEEPQIDYKALYGGLLDDFKIYDYTLYRENTESYTEALVVRGVINSQVDELVELNVGNDRNELKVTT